MDRRDSVAASTLEAPHLTLPLLRNGPLPLPPLVRAERAMSSPQALLHRALLVVRVLAILHGRGNDRRYGILKRNHRGPAIADGFRRSRAIKPANQLLDFFKLPARCARNDDRIRRGVIHDVERLSRGEAATPFRNGICALGPSASRRSASEESK